MSLPSRLRMTPEAASELAVKLLLFLAADAERMSRFAGATGFDPSDARTAAAQHGFLAGVIAYALSDEPLLVAFAEAENIKPVTVPMAYRVIPGGDPALEINIDAFR